MSPIIVCITIKRLFVTTFYPRKDYNITIVSHFLILGQLYLLVIFKDEICINCLLFFECTFREMINGVLFVVASES